MSKDDRATQGGSKLTLVDEDDSFTIGGNGITKYCFLLPNRIVIVTSVNGQGRSWNFNGIGVGPFIADPNVVSNGVRARPVHLPLFQVRVGPNGILNFTEWFAEFAYRGAVVLYGDDSRSP